MAITEKNLFELRARYLRDRQNRKHIDAPDDPALMTEHYREVRNFPLTKPEVDELLTAAWDTCEGMTADDHKAADLARPTVTHTHYRDASITVKVQVKDGDTYKERDVVILERTASVVTTARKLLDAQGAPDTVEPCTERCTVMLRERVSESIRGKLSEATFGMDRRADGKVTTIDQATEERRIFALTWDLYKEVTK